MKIFTCLLKRKKQICGSLPLKGCLLEFVLAMPTQILTNFWLSVNFKEPSILSIGGSWGGPVFFISNADLSNLVWILRGLFSLAVNWNPNFLLTSTEGKSWTEGEDRKKFSLRSWNSCSYFPCWRVGLLWPRRLVSRKGAVGWNALGASGWGNGEKLESLLACVLFYSLTCLLFLSLPALLLLSPFLYSSSALVWVQFHKKF